jgi:hypothetical protein
VYPIETAQCLAKPRSLGYDTGIAEADAYIQELMALLAAVRAVAKIRPKRTNATTTRSVYLGKDIVTSRANSLPHGGTARTSVPALDSSRQRPAPSVRTKQAPVLLSHDGRGCGDRATFAPVAKTSAEQIRRPAGLPVKIPSKLSNDATSALKPKTKWTTPAPTSNGRSRIAKPRPSEKGSRCTTSAYDGISSLHRTLCTACADTWR